MTAGVMMDPARFLDEHLAQASPDLLRQLLATFIDTLMSAEADAVCGAEYGARSPERVSELFSVAARWSRWVMLSGRVRGGARRGRRR